jgi:hypothetical protein
VAGRDPRPRRRPDLPADRDRHEVMPWLGSRLLEHLLNRGGERLRRLERNEVPNPGEVLQRRIPEELIQAIAPGPGKERVPLRTEDCGGHGDPLARVGRHLRETGRDRPRPGAIPADRGSGRSRPSVELDEPLQSGFGVAVRGPDQCEQKWRRYACVAEGLPSMSSAARSSWWKAWYQNSRWAPGLRTRSPCGRGPGLPGCRCHTPRRPANPARAHPMSPSTSASARRPSTRLRGSSQCLSEAPNPRRSGASTSPRSLSRGVTAW